MRTARHLARAGLLTGPACPAITKDTLRLSLIALFIVSLLLLAARDSAAQSPCSGQWYRVQQADSWSKLAQRTGLSVATLKAANPAAAI
ncbi:MAG TPA: LysM domain-containing protein, partial [Anaerolineae bacterium]|nr:LysM domain-containing protein [Anaerolineae bacterium]